MKRQNPNRIAELRLAKRWSQRELAAAIGAHYMTISKLERGDMRLTQQWMEQLGFHLGVSPSEILSDSSLVRSVYMNGSISDRFEVEDVEQITRSDELDSVKYEVNYGVDEPNLSMFLFVCTDIYSPAMQSGDIVRFTHFAKANSNHDSFLGRICVLECNEPKRFTIGILENSKEHGAFDLRSPFNRYERGIRPDRIHVLTMVIGLPDVIVDDEGVPV